LQQAVKKVIAKCSG